MLYHSPNLRVECSDGIATLWLDAPNGNALGLELLLDVSRAIEAVRRSPAAQVLVIRSACPDEFLIGPRMTEYEQLKCQVSRREFARTGQQIIQQMQGLSNAIPTIAMINGVCRGTGLELALACDFRVAVARPATRFEFDFASNGLLPCWGATQLLPRLMGPTAAMEVLTHAATLSARAAKRVGLVDHAFTPRPAKTELWWFVSDVRDQGRRPRSRPWWRRLLEHPTWIDGMVVRSLLNRLPATSSVRPMIESLRHGWRYGVAEGFAAERAAFAERCQDANAAELRRLASERESFSFRWRSVEVPRRIGVYGSGPHALRLAVAALIAGGSAVMDRDGGVKQELKWAIDRGWLSVTEAEQAYKRLTVDPSQFDHCELVFVTGELAEQKQALFDLDEYLDPQVGIVATNLELTFRPSACRLHHPERIVSIGLDSPTILVRPIERTRHQVPARLFRWLEQCGERPVLTPEPDQRPQPIAA